MLLKQLVEQLMEIQITNPGADSWEVCDDTDVRLIGVEADAVNKTVYLEYP